ncbi:CmcJ/NvfI family oxidoreductase [Tolypothrix sp. VBCCA 56010]|uniref:CmcJ/NvfI family oxidoreductase n=1 Tax=Tolypothrix sp. VBCCA 56010 TaxID=3137731 RepID=UPI003D7D5893
MSLSSPILSKPVLEDLPYVEAVLNYLTPMAEKPVNYTYEPPAGVPRQNGVYEAHKLPIRNARAIPSPVGDAPRTVSSANARDLSLDREGFAYASHNSAVRDFYDEDEVRRVYYPEAEQLLADVTGAKKVLVFDHNLRNIQRVKQGENNIKEPVKRVHNDFTAKSGYSRARAELQASGTDDIEELLQHRFSIINVWRPIAQPVQESPLAVCDAQSIAPKDLVAGDLVYRDRVGETYAITYNPAHRWFYFPQLQPNEALFIKCFDSAEDGRARFAAHTAFDDPTSPPDAPPRESIELRALVFYGN